jgi:hypothetical protein
MSAAIAELDEGEFTEGHELDRKWQVSEADDWATAGGSEEVVGFQFGLLSSENPAIASVMQEEVWRSALANRTSKPATKRTNSPPADFGCYFL